MPPAHKVRRVHVVVNGLVQGVGFRPWVVRLALDLGLGGWVANTGRGVEVQVEGPAAQVELALAALRDSAPGEVRSVAWSDLAPNGFDAFAIAPSQPSSQTETSVPRDRAPCSACARELFDPADRRYRYPFISCAECGPRWSIIAELPFDRLRTTMAHFDRCSECAQEYADPSDRRFHAQTTACSVCGPHVWAVGAKGAPLGSRDVALKEAVSTLRGGGIVAARGVGGYHLLADASNPAAVELLRARKRRPDKPLACMVADVEQAAVLGKVTSTSRQALRSPHRPIVLLQRLSSALAAAVAPATPTIGLMLPSSPLHAVLLRDFGGPLVATSGNRGGERMCVEPSEAEEVLAQIADLFLHHDRGIVRALDDPIEREICGRMTTFRIGRGTAPLELVDRGASPEVAGSSSGPNSPSAAERVLGAGGHDKATVALAVGGIIRVSAHLGDLTTADSRRAWRVGVDTLEGLAGPAGRTVTDLHSGYGSTIEAGARVEVLHPVDAMQHHHAHAVSAMVEHGLVEETLAVVWDGTGLGPDGTVWGGEWLVADRREFRRIKHLRAFVLPGGEAAIHDVRRAALALIDDAAADAGTWLTRHTTEPERRAWRALAASSRSPRTSAAGRLFDGVAALLGLASTTSFDGQAPMTLEAAASAHVGTAEPYPWSNSRPSKPLPSSLELDWRPTIRAIVRDRIAGCGVELIAARFHATATEWIVQTVLDSPNLPVLLTGGCFQNRLLAESAAAALRDAGRRVYLHSRVPPNDAGLAVGQAAYRSSSRPVEA